MTAQNPSGQDDPTVALGLVARFRAEHAAQQDKTSQALLLHECGVLEENRGEEPVAARDYLAAFNADPQFREPLEALVRILTRRKSIKNLGKLLDALTRAASSADERARALWERSAFIQTHENNLQAAKELLEEAVGQTAEDPALWLELEILAGKEGDVPGRMRALEARAELAVDPTWKALLFIDLAELAAAAEESARAYELLGTAAALEGKARFRTQLVLEQLARKDDNVEALARALEGQADLVEEAIEDAASGDANGVPRYLRNGAHAADLWYRAADVKRRIGDAASVAGMLDRAALRLPTASAIQRARLVALEAQGDAAGAAAIAKAELDRGVGGPGAASLWLRVAEAAALANERGGALGALRNALEADPACIPARALLLDLLGDGQEPGALAGSLEAAADTFGGDEPKGRAFLLAAYVWAVQGDETTDDGGDASAQRPVEAAKVALSQAAACGIDRSTVARASRTLAALRGDAAWYEDSTKRLVAAGAEAAELPGLWYELGRSRLLRGDETGAGEAFAKLASVDGEPAAWLGRVLGAYALGLRDDGEEKKPRSPEAVEELAKVETDPLLARGLWLVSALRNVGAGKLDAARARLRELQQAAPSDEVVAVFLADLDRRAGDAASAAAALSACASAAEDTDFAAALHIEAAILLFRAGERSAAIQSLEAARRAAPRAGATLLTWALRGADPDTLEGRRRALEVAAEAGADPVGIAFERFGLEASIGEPAEALAALEIVEKDGTDDLAIGAALGRIAWPTSASDRQGLDRALDQLEECGEDAAALARAERHRLARSVDRDLGAAAERASEWADKEPSLPVALEWLASSLAAEDRGAEVTARSLAALQFDGAARAALEASAALVGMLDQGPEAQLFVSSTEPPAQLMNLEIALPGCDPRRRAAALQGLGDALGDEAALDARALSGWSELAAGDAEEARTSFQTVLEHRQGDVACWEGVRAASEALEDHVQEALACAQLGALCKSNERGSTFWERAGVILLEHTDAKEDAEIAFERAFGRDPRRGVAFDKLFRAVRGRNEDDRLLQIIAKRLEVSEDEAEIGKLYWERARVLRKKGDTDGALAALENVTMLEPDHVGALALSGEILITRGAFAEAAPFLARLATIDEAPRQQRLMSGVAAVDLFENKLGEPEKALEVLIGLHKAGLSTGQVRERLARVAARAGAWGEATGILEVLMNERDKPEGRVEAARLGMTIWRDKLKVPVRAQSAVERLLSEVPDDPEAVGFVLDTPAFDQGFRMQVLGRAKITLIQRLAGDPTDIERVDLLARIAQANNDMPLRQAALGALVALGRGGAMISDELARIDARVPARPQITLDENALAEIADPEDGGPLTELFAVMAETITLALGPSLSSRAVTKKDRVDARGGNPLRSAVSEWMGAVGLTGDFDLFLGGPEPHGACGIAGEQPALVVGTQVGVPFDATARTAVAREVFALRRGITCLRPRERDDVAVACILVAACNEAGFNVPAPPYAVYGEISRSIKKEISRKTRKQITEICQRILSSGEDGRHWAVAAQRSLDRMAAIAAGDVSIVLGDLFGVPRERLGGLVVDNDRARRLLAFVLSPSYLELRKKLGMGVR